MTLDQFFRAAYVWCDANALALLLVCGLAYPVVATLLSMAGKGGKTDKDGKFYASLLVVVGFFIRRIFRRGFGLSGGRES